MSNAIIVINATILEAPPPETYQETGAFISQGATSLTPGTYSLLTQSSNITTLLAPPIAISSLSWSAGTVIVTASTVIPGLNTGDTFITTIAGASPSGYNGTYLATVTGSNTLTYTLAVNPGVETISGTFTPSNQGELVSMNTTYWSQGTSQAVYVLELGAGDQSTGAAALSTWIGNNPNFFYVYLIPRSWDATSGLLALIAQFETPASKTYFAVTTTTGTYTVYTPVMKNVIAEVESPNVPITEFSLAADFQHILNYAPSSTNKMTPNNGAYLYGVTSYPQMGNGPLLTSLLAANVNYIGTGAEGNISNTILFQGKTLDGNDFAFWYSSDWIQLNCDLDLANYVISQRQNSSNPLYYNQNGIDRLQDVAVETFGNSISYGLATGTVVQTTLDQTTFNNNLENGTYAGMNVINAVPFLPWVQANPNTYGQGVYGGFSGVYIPQNSFTQIFFNLTVTNLVASL